MTSSAGLFYGAERSRLMGASEAVQSQSYLGRWLSEKWLARIDAKDG
jgi:hypothetical protein